MHPYKQHFECLKIIRNVYPLLPQITILLDFKMQKGRLIEIYYTEVSIGHII
jgi:hypothetical protein